MCNESSAFFQFFSSHVLVPPSMLICFYSWQLLQVNAAKLSSLTSFEGELEYSFANGQQAAAVDS